MCGFVGFVDYKNDTSKYKDSLLEMNSCIAKRGPDEDGYYINKNVALAHKRLIVIDPEGGKQPMTESYAENEYTICYNGQIYNTNELKKDLEKHRILS